MFEQFVKELAYLKNVSPITISSYRQAHNRYLKHGQETLPTKASLNQFVVGMREAGLASTTYQPLLASFVDSERQLTS